MKLVWRAGCERWPAVRPTTQQLQLAVSGSDQWLLRGQKLQWQAMAAQTWPCESIVLRVFVQQESERNVVKRVTQEYMIAHCMHQRCSLTQWLAAHRSPPT